jgi:hypothetical protein
MNRIRSIEPRAMRSLAIFVGLGCALLLGSSSAAFAQYIGSDACAECHMPEYNDWKVSGHPYKLADAESARQRPIPLPEGYTWDDISYVIGGYKWKSRYIDLDGYIITTAITDEGPVDGMNQYNNLTGAWSNYHPGEVGKPYDCGSCHTTGWVADDDWDTDEDLSDNQDGLPGMHGTFAFGGVQCEECHGAGYEMAVDSSTELCGRCHIRGAPDTIPASGGFIRHHEQYNEHLASPHSELTCVNCHDPHKKGEFSLHTTCADCHADYAESYAGSVMDVRGVACEDCHMPFASKSAQALGPHQGDIRTHLFTINTKRNAEMFTADGSLVLLDAHGKGAVTLDFACQRCHTDKSFQWIEGKAKNFHNRGPNYQGEKPHRVRGNRQ